MPAQEEVDDLIHDEAEEVAQAEDVLRTHRQVDLRSGREVTNEEVERYVKERYEDPALREAALRDDGGEQAGAFPGPGRSFPSGSLLSTTIESVKSPSPTKGGVRRYVRECSEDCPAQWAASRVMSIKHNDATCVEQIGACKLNVLLWPLHLLLLCEQWGGSLLGCLVRLQAQNWLCAAL